MHSLENEYLADDVLEEVTKIIRSFPFDFQGARIISGKEEGAYGWITINYLLGKFTKVIILQHPWSSSRGPMLLLSQAVLGLPARINDG